MPFFGRARLLVVVALASRRSSGGRFLGVLLLAATALRCNCGSFVGELELEDAGVDGGEDAGRDAGQNGGFDGGFDAGGPDAGLDAGVCVDGGTPFISGLPAAFQLPQYQPFRFSFQIMCAAGYPTLSLEGQIPLGLIVNEPGDVGGPALDGTLEGIPDPNPAVFTVIVTDGEGRMGSETVSMTVTE